jgi:hypothetical protein
VQLESSGICSNRRFLMDWASDQYPGFFMVHGWQPLACEAVRAPFRGKGGC